MFMGSVWQRRNRRNNFNTKQGFACVANAIERQTEMCQV